MSLLILHSDRVAVLKKCALEVRLIRLRVWDELAPLDSLIIGDPLKSHAPAPAHAIMCLPRGSRLPLEARLFEVVHRASTLEGSPSHTPDATIRSPTPLYRVPDMVQGVDWSRREFSARARCAKDIDRMAVTTAAASRIDAVRVIAGNDTSAFALTAPHKSASLAGWTLRILRATHDGARGSVPGTGCVRCLALCVAEGRKKPDNQSQDMPQH